VEDAGIRDMTEWRTGLVSATSVGGMDTTERYFKEYLENEEVRRYILSHDPGDSTHKIADALGIRGFITTISTACSSAANAIMLGARLILSGELDRVIVGGTDALSKFTIKRLQNPDDPLGYGQIPPFDRDRKGLNLGEAAAYLVLESDAAIKSREQEGFSVFIRFWQCQ
ncbi:MAG: beta-ketoacyl-[acyl-carrier-protein] synthase family protein, partial [Leadbetterella sp.]|nr:beta-ketoacyl-[acyl-carrier-protein] synthase family protein [Leadbetterella sp.]